jgi:hypothetical protein
LADHTVKVHLDNLYYLFPSASFIAGGVRTNMYSNLPRPLLSKSGFQGCIASFETNGELEDPLKHALVPSPLVEEGCEGTFIVQPLDGATCIFAIS